MFLSNNKPAQTYLSYGALALVGSFLILGYVYLPKGFHASFEAPAAVIKAVATTTEAVKPILIPTHITTPEVVKGIYMTGWVAGTLTARDRVLGLIEDTEINTIVIDVKDYTGRISFEVNDPYLVKIGSSEKRIRDIREFIDSLHKKNIYVIGRISSFQDAYFVSIHPEWAVKKKSDGSVWKDHKGISWLDVSAKPVWDYLVAIAEESYEAGFDELNFDYIRFPSDGNMSDISFPFSSEIKKSDAVNNFFVYLRNQLKDKVISADLFGMTTTSRDDMSIGQVLENGLANFDYVDPMVYPSHYPPGFNGYANPNHFPYEIVKLAMDSAVTRAKMASTTPMKLRPWLQDFNYGGVYDATAVRKQIQATYDAGLTSWILWSPSNNYTKGALFPQVAN
ncbi:MAG: glycoside hydrolase [Candidatus Taylorbacteria bacterium]|nr:glycoside hydrolase [Candidatus Taylorbacteria bacterium]